MDAIKVQIAAQKIADLEKALNWMQLHGEFAINPSDKTSFGISVQLNSASSCPGAHEARLQLSAQARLLGREILANSIKDAENTIEIYRQQIADEIGK